jgi:6-phosphogluconolactonase
MQIEIFDGPEELATGTANLLADLLSAGASTFGLSGGSTPRQTYRELQARDVPWHRLTLWLPDERWVPREDPESNTLMARRELVDHVPTRFLAPDTTLEDPSIAAEAYERILNAELAPAPGVVLLGMGPDGHTASLFPGTEALDIDRRGYTATWVPAFNTWRLTATVPLLASAEHVVFLVAGASKADAVRSILVDDEPLPAGLVSREVRDVTWMLDADAATEIR